MSVARIEGANLPLMKVVDHNNDITTAKITKVILGILTGLGVLGGAALIGLAAAEIIPTVLGFWAVPLLLGAGAFIWKIIRTKDYQDPNALAEYRRQAEIDSLDRTVDEHGWENIFAHKILAPENFTERYRAATQNMTVTRGIDTYEAAEGAYRSYRMRGDSAVYAIPHPREFKQQFFREVAGSTNTYILEHYDIEKLVKYGIIEQTMYRALRDCERALAHAKETRRQELAGIQRGYEQAIAPHEQQLKNVRLAVEAARTARLQRDWEAYKHQNARPNPHDYTIVQACQNFNYWERHFAPKSYESAKEEGLLRDAQRVYDQAIAPLNAQKRTAEQVVESRYQYEINRINNN